MLAASSTVDAIKATVGKKLAVWGSQLKDNAPQTRVPSLNAVFGGVLIFSGVHVWTADTKGAEQRAAWRTTLGMTVAIDIGAKVATGEMLWG